MGVVPATRSLKVSIADGGQLHCTQEITSCAWPVQGHKFCSTLKGTDIGMLWHDHWDELA